MDSSDEENEEEDKEQGEDDEIIDCAEQVQPVLSPQDALLALGKVVTLEDLSGSLAVQARALRIDTNWQSLV